LRVDALSATKRVGHTIVQGERVNGEGGRS
jgi:hypothetical protein